MSPPEFPPRFCNFFFNSRPAPFRRCEEASLTLSDFEGSKKKLMAENADLLRQVEELDNNNITLQKIRWDPYTILSSVFSLLRPVFVLHRSTLQAQLEEQRRLGDDEAKERSFLLGKFRNLEHEYDLARDSLEEEHAAKADSARQLAKAAADVAAWRQRYERDGLARAEELEAAKMKLQSRLAEAQVRRLLHPFVRYDNQCSWFFSTRAPLRP